MKNSQKGFIVPLIIAIVVILIAGGAYLAYKNEKGQTEQAEQTNNQFLASTTVNTNVGISGTTASSTSTALQTYSNSKYGFSIQYPASMRVSTFKPGNPNTIFGLQMSDPDNTFILVSNTKDGNKSLKDDKNQIISLYKNDPEAKLEIHDFLIGNNPAFSASYIGVTVSDTSGKKNFNPNFVIETYKNNYLYVLEVATSSENQILSTFKFTN